MKKVDKKKKDIKKKKTLQANKKRKIKKNNIPPKKTTTKKSVNNTIKKDSNIIENKNIKKEPAKTGYINVEKIDKKEKKKLSLTKSITMPKIKEDKLSLTKSILLPKLKISNNDKKLSLTKSITIPKLKLKNNSLTKSITIPKIKEVEQNYIELDLFDDKHFQEAEKLYRNKDYEESYKIYNSLLYKYKKDKRLYKRLICTLTKDYTYKDNSKEFKKIFEDYITTYKLLANKKEVKSLDYNLETYKKVKGIRRKSKLLIIAFLGFFGIHKFLEKKFVIGILYLLTLGFLGIGVFIDMVNDYAEYEDTLQLDILRYLISFAIMTVGILNRNLEYYYLIIIASIIFIPFIYGIILKYIPGLIKIVVIIILIIYGFKTKQVIEYVPNSIIGNWKTINESTNYEELKIELEKTTLFFDDREKEIGTNEYDSQNKILMIKIDDTKVYKFMINNDGNSICSYNDARECIIEFNKS